MSTNSHEWFFDVQSYDPADISLFVRAGRSCWSFVLVVRAGRPHSTRDCATATPALDMARTVLSKGMENMY